jgi:hypothetical protein
LKTKRLRGLYQVFHAHHVAQERVHHGWWTGGTLLDTSQISRPESAAGISGSWLHEDAIESSVSGDSRIGH